MIVGEDWLEAVSPVWVDYKTKAIRITHQGKRIALQGVKDQLDSCSPISVKKLRGLIKHGGVSCCIQLQESDSISSVSDELQYVCSVEQEDTAQYPPEIQELIQAYDHLFSTPTQLPPQRNANHHIELTPGVQPVRVRPYHYSPIQKTEIEVQVKQML
jgi:hypothetical protein